MGEPATETVPIDSAKAARGLDLGCKKQWHLIRMGLNGDHYSEASHGLSESMNQSKRSGKLVLMSLHQCKAECHQRIDGGTQCYFGLTDQDLWHLQLVI